MTIPQPPTPPTMPAPSTSAPTDPVPPKHELVLTIGMRTVDQAPAQLELRHDTGVVVAAPAGSGKTSALRTLAAAARRADPSCHIVVVSEHPDQWPGVATTLPADPRPTLVLVDGIASVTMAMVREVDAAQHDRLWVAIADRLERFQTGPSWLRQGLIGRTGLLLDPQRNDGDLFRISLPPPPAPCPRGCGFLVKDGVPEPVQVVA